MKTLCTAGTAEKITEYYANFVKGSNIKTVLKDSAEHTFVRPFRILIN